MSDAPLQSLAFGVIALTGLYLVALGGCALLRPAWARAFLLGHAGTAGRHYLELALRLLVGVALLVLAPELPWPRVFTMAGRILVVTTLVLALVPWRRHQAFARRSVPQALRFLPLLGAVSLAVGAGLLHALFAG